MGFVCLTKMWSLLKTCFIIAKVREIGSKKKWLMTTITVWLEVKMMSRKMIWVYVMIWDVFHANDNGNVFVSKRGVNNY